MGGDDLIVESFDKPSQASGRGRPKKNTQTQSMMGGINGDDDDMTSSQIPDTITFTNTTTYGRILGQPPKDANSEDPDVVKYMKGYGSVKGLHYRKYIALELLSENNFSCSFHKFFSHEIKNLIRQIAAARFDVEIR